MLFFLQTVTGAIAGSHHWCCQKAHITFRHCLLFMLLITNKHHNILTFGLTGVFFLLNQTPEFWGTTRSKTSQISHCTIQSWCLLTLHSFHVNEQSHGTVTFDAVTWAITSSQHSHLHCPVSFQARTCLKHTSCDNQNQWISLWFWINRDFNFLGNSISQIPSNFCDSYRFERFLFVGHMTPFLWFIQVHSRCMFNSGTFQHLDWNRFLTAFLHSFTCIHCHCQWIPSHRSQQSANSGHCLFTQRKSTLNNMLTWLLLATGICHSTTSLNFLI